MNKKKLIVRLEDVYGRMEQLEFEELRDIIRQNNKTKDTLEEIIQDIEDEGVIEEKEEDEASEA